MVDIASSQIKVGEELSGAGAQVSQIAAAVEDELDQLRTKLQPLQEAWTRSQAAAMYQDDMNLWNTAALALFGVTQGPYQAGQGVLGAIANMLDTNNGNYVDAEAANVKTWTPSS
ncbi:WXG100 family type VII secretion target [Actinacidiphila oryziradicis]|uniref:WXG100 family type VII secretion target n=1 Tax=Actinacidiphila oryziradicis TaxID=2571141 RepID=A0A4U0S1S1_9ACTN|nr:WXG100 family type VII secretion target [Actinacidiphila oryziradicis]TKA02068.1 WXG100 family type VII secretion target [Actinacidiphila oryziradicis]